MAANRLETLIGVPGQANTPDHRAQAILDSLKYGFNLGFECGTPQVDTSHWGTMRVLEQTQADNLRPFERLASTLAGMPTVFEVAITAGVEGTNLSLGFDSASALARTRRVLAPGCRLDLAQIPTLPHPSIVGVTHRAQAVEGTVTDSPGAIQTLLDKLESVGEGWTLFMHCESVAFNDVLRVTRRLDDIAEETASHLNTTEQVTETLTSTAVSHRWLRVQNWVGILTKLLSEGVGTGLWTVDTWATAADDDTAQMVAGALHASIARDEGRWYETLAYPQPSPGEPPPTSVLTSKDLGCLLSAPRASQPGLAVRQAPPSGRRPSVGPTAIRLGSYQGTTITSAISLDDIEGHGFVTGTTGSGKSTTLHRLLAELWNKHGIPFLVLDPVKDDYSPVARYFNGGIQLLRGADIHLNLLEPWPKEDLRNHITQVASAFRGAFSMPSPTPYVVTQLFDKVAMLPSGGASMSLFDVRDMVPRLISSLGYAPEQESNIRAALMTRLNLLLAPTRAHRFSWTDSSMIAELFKRPTVVTLGDLGDDEERSFVVLLLALATWAFAKARKCPRPVEHVLVLEEAHRILPEVDDRNVDPEVGSAKQVSAGMLSAMMAEVRSYGEQILVVDQSPSKVSADVSRNTNLKIAHRVVHPDDQRQVTGMLGLPDEAAALLGELDRGCAIYTTRTEPSAQTLAVAHIADMPNPPGGKITTVTPPTPSWPCGTGNPEAHYRAWQLGPDAARPMSLFLAGVLWGDGNGRKLREYVYRELLAVADGDQSLTDCLAWSGIRQLTARRRMAGPASGPNSADAQLASLYQVWAGHLPVTQASAEGAVAIPPANVALAGDAYLTWEEQSISSVMLDAEPRNGLRALKTTSWRSELPEVEAYLKNRLAALEPLLGDGAKSLLRVLVTGAVGSANLTTDVADKLISRAGLTKASS